MEQGFMKMDIFTIHEEYYQEGNKILICHIFYPQFISNTMDTKDLNTYFYTMALRKKNYSDTVLYPSAVEAYRHHSAALPYEMLITIELTLQNRQFISFYQEEYLFTGGANGSTTRKGYTIDVLTGKRRTLCSFVKNQKTCHACIIGSILQQIAKSNMPSMYFEDYRSLVVENFDEQNFYLTKEGIIVFFAMYDIAPHASGIPTFLIPYNQC